MREELQSPESLWVSVLELIETSAAAQCLDELEGVLPGLAELAQSPLAFLHISDARLTEPRFFQFGLQATRLPAVKDWCVEQVTAQTDQPLLWQGETDIVVYPLRGAGACVGLMGLAAGSNLDSTAPRVWAGLLSALGNVINHLVYRTHAERQLAFLNAYLSVSSMLAQSLDLHELLSLTLYCCMEVACAEAATVLLLDDEKKIFSFYHVEGAAKPMLEMATFPADKGIAGAVLRTQQSEVINDVHSDPRFYGRVEQDSGITTRNMVAIPLTAGAEQIGVLEVLNKADGGLFTDAERRLLLSLSEEIAFAIRNAKVFEYVVNTYCKQRQGQMSCRGCTRPLGSWTPCVKYQQTSAF